MGGGPVGGQTGTTVNGSGDRVFDVKVGTTVSISDLRIINGHAPDGTNGLDAEAPSPGGSVTATSGGPGADGGGIMNAGTLTLTRLTLTNNSAGRGGVGGTAQGADGGSAGQDGGSGIAGSGGNGGNGGAIRSTGVLTIRDSLITFSTGGPGGSGGQGRAGNGAVGAPGGDGGNSHGGNGGNGGIGAISVAGGSLDMSGSTVTKNTGGAGGRAGGTANGRGGNGTGNGDGGIGATNVGGNGGSGAPAGIAGPGSMTITTSAITDNTAGDGDTVGAAATGAGGDGDGTGDGGPGGNGVGGNGGAGGSGAGIAASSLISLSRTLVAGNKAGKGGIGGSGQGAGGGTGSPPGGPGVGQGGVGGSGGTGGGLRSNGGTPSLVNVTFDANTPGNGGTGGDAVTAKGVGLGGNGGAGGSGGNASLTGGSANHLTVTGGTAGTGGIGGAVISLGGPALPGSTTGSQGSNGVGPAISATGGGITAGNSVFSGSGCTGTADGAHNIAFGATGCPGTATDPKLGPLADNGGPSQTRRLLAGSPALDFVPATGANCALTDQRGAVRPFGAACDAGAFELAPPAVTTGPAQGVTFNAATATGTLTPRGLAATFRVEFGETAAYGQTSAASISASATPAAVSVALSGLKPSTTYHYRFIAQSPDGTATGQDTTFTTTAAPPPPAAKPSLIALAVKPARFRVAAGSTPVSRSVARRRKATPKGTTISYRLSVAATVKLAVQRPGNGVKARRRGKTVCVAASRARFRRAPKRSRCTVFRTRGTLTRRGVAGLNRVRFTGRIGRRALALGTYRLLASAQNAAGRSASRTKTFRIVKR